jgi:hypothetical protein
MAVRNRRNDYERDEDEEEQVEEEFVDNESIISLESDFGKY